MKLKGYLPALLVMLIPSIGMAQHQISAFSQSTLTSVTNVASIPDLDGDGRDDLILGHNLEVVGPSLQGSVRVRSGATGALIHQVIGNLGEHSAFRSELSGT